MRAYPVVAVEEECKGALAKVFSQHSAQRLVFNVYTNTLLRSMPVLSNGGAFKMTLPTTVIAGSVWLFDVA